MSEKIIYNCHNHIFTHEDVPNGYFPLSLVPLMRVRSLRWMMSGLMKMVVPWTENDKAHRYAAFLKAAFRKDQEGNLKHLMGYYPEGTKFIILPMDLSLMGAGKVIEDIDDQHQEIIDLLADDRYRDSIIPFAHIDPRRSGAKDRLKRLVEDHGFMGVKIYPTLGYAPDHPVLMDEIYPYMIEKGIPLMAHCSPGVVNSKELDIEDAHALADPNQYKRVMEVHGDLKICLGHFGGISEWRRHLNQPRDAEKPTWLTKIKELIKSGHYPNLYTDISYTIFNFQENLPLLKLLLEDEIIRDRVLFGSDFFMVESERYSEKRLSIDLRAGLGEEKFWKIANENPKSYLGI